MDAWSHPLCLHTRSHCRCPRALPLSVSARLPGSALNLLFLSWLYAYYCFDYKWALQGVRLPQRLRFFEANWAYFAGGCVALPQRAAAAAGSACVQGSGSTVLHVYVCTTGFGFPCVAATMFRTFHVGAALANLLFPVFVMVACGADPMLARGACSLGCCCEAVGSGCGSTAQWGLSADGCPPVC